MKRLFLPGAYLAMSLLWLSSCSENETMLDQKSQLEVRLTDDPADYDAVNIDISDVQINVTDDDNGWQSLANVHQGVYNLLDLVNDKDTLLALAEIPSGRLHQMRLVLGTNNTVVVDGVSYPLETPSAQQSGLKLNIQQDVTAGILYTVTLDFDASRSIVKTGNNKYLLKPVIRTVLAAAGGSISGYVLPDSVQTAVWAIQGIDTVAGTYTGTNGGYLIKGLNSGAYDLHYMPGDTSFKPAMYPGILVNTGQVTTVDTLNLQK